MAKQIEKPFLTNIFPNIIWQLVAGESLQDVKITIPYCPHILPVQGQHADVDRVLDKGDIVHELVGGEGGDGVQEEGRAALEVAYRHRVQALVHLHIGVGLIVQCCASLSSHPKKSQVKGLQVDH